MDTGAVPVGDSEDSPRAVWGSEELVESERDVILVNVALGRNPGGLDLSTPLARASTPFVAPRPTPITHTQTRLRLDRIY